MLRGSVKWFDSKKGFGFIIGPEGEDVFVHFSSIEGDGFRSLKDGEPVEYEIVRGEKGLSAQRVRRVNARDGKAAGAGEKTAGSAPAASVARTERPERVETPAGKSPTANPS